MSILIKGIDMPSKITQIRIYPNGIIFCANEDGVYVPKAKAIEIDDEAIDIAQDIIDGCKRFKERRADETDRCR